jgi:hypothetical protein
MVYDGLYLRFYLDDLMDSVRATGNLITNNYNTLIGYTAGFNPNWYTQYFGYIDEVRFWNVARTKKQIKENAYTTIADPVNQDGLKAYFDFQTGYQNKAGNEIHSGVERGNCALAVDTASCPINHSPDKLNKIIMYPNLIYNTGTIRFNVEVTNAEITIFDVCGKKLNIVKEISGNELKIDRKNVASGLYFVILKQENKAISISKLVVVD